MNVTLITVYYVTFLFLAILCVHPSMRRLSRRAIRGFLLFKARSVAMFFIFSDAILKGLVANEHGDNKQFNALSCGFLITFYLFTLTISMAALQGFNPIVFTIGYFFSSYLIRLKSTNFRIHSAVSNSRKAYLEIRQHYQQNSRK